MNSEKTPLRRQTNDTSIQMDSSTNNCCCPAAGAVNPKDTTTNVLVACIGLLSVFLLIQLALTVTRVWLTFKVFNVECNYGGNTTNLTNIANSTNSSLDSTRKLVPLARANDDDVFSDVTFVVYIITSLLEIPQALSLLYLLLVWYAKHTKTSGLRAYCDILCECRCFKSGCCSCLTCRKNCQIFCKNCIPWCGLFCCFNPTLQCCISSLPGGEVLCKELERSHKLRWHFRLSVLTVMAYFVVAAFTIVYETLANHQYAEQCGVNDLRAKMAGLCSGYLRLEGVIMRTVILYLSLVIHARFKAVLNCKDPTFDNCREEYINLTKFHHPLLVFESWFIFTWILYSILTISVLTTIIRDVLISHELKFSEVYSKEEYVYLSFNAVFSLMSYLIPYIVALNVNSWHQEAYKKLMQKNPDSSFRKNEDLDFVPRFCAVRLPLESIQYFLPILLPTLSLIWGFTIKI